MPCVSASTARPKKLTCRLTGESLPLLKRRSLTSGLCSGGLCLGPDWLSLSRPCLQDSRLTGGHSVSNSLSLIPKFNRFSSKFSSSSFLFADVSFIYKQESNLRGIVIEKSYPTMQLEHIKNHRAIKNTHWFALVIVKATSVWIAILSVILEPGASLRTATTYGLSHNHFVT